MIDKEQLKSIREIYGREGSREVRSVTFRNGDRYSKGHDNIVCIIEFIGVDNVTYYDIFSDIFPKNFLVCHKLEAISYVLHCNVDKRYLE